MKTHGPRDATMIAVLFGASALCYVSLLVQASLMPPPVIQITPAPACGPSPLAPGWTADIDANRVTLGLTDYDAISEYHHRVRIWSDCIEGRAHATR